MPLYFLYPLVCFAGLSLGIWVYLLLFRGQFWRVDLASECPAPSPSPNPCAGPLPFVSDATGDPSDSLVAGYAKAADLTLPAVCVVIPARNEAAVLPRSLASILYQTYLGQMDVILVDDQSDDGTSAVALHTAELLGRCSQLQILPGTTLPSGWSGKLWAMAQGVRRAELLDPAPKYLLFTDADISHDPGNLARLVARAEAQQLSMVSLMVHLRCSSFWERWLIPAFVFFFQKLYPFRWVNSPTHSMAAAAGGCILIRLDSLEGIGGLEVIHKALIDDCTLAQAVKRNDRRVYGEGRLWLGLSDTTCSLRSYPDLDSIWSMVSRTAFSQLDHSPFLLMGTLVGMGVVYLLPPFGFFIGVLLGDSALLILGLGAWVLMAIAFVPMLRFYRLSPLRAAALPLIGFLFSLMTFDSALNYWRGRGGAWKGRTYEAG